VNKGETLVDTARTVEAMGVDALVVRAKQSGAAALIQSAVRVPVINAGDGRHEHPTQGLLDAATIAHSHHRADFNLTGLTVAIVGDIVNSRVARSNIAALGTLGATIICVGPPSMAPRSLESLGTRVSHDLDRVLPVADAVMMLRIQFERQGEAPLLASVRDYRDAFALTRARMARLKPGAIIMHPGPMNRGIEIDADVADGPRSVIFQQVAQGVLVRMAVLEACVLNP
jgi:aspartate carbamoyltransferase catalytic subunit